MGRMRGMSAAWLVSALMAAGMVLQIPAQMPKEPAGTGIEAGRLDALLSRYHELGLFDGTALVAKNGQAILAKGYGMADYEMAVPNGPDTVHWIGSVSKVFTATLVIRLADAGKLSLDQSVSSILPWYREDVGKKVTLRHLLNHTSGIPDYMHLPGIGREGFRKEAGDGLIDVRSFVRTWCSSDLAFEPGTRWAYSNSGYVILGAIVEQVTGQRFEQAMKAWVLDPVGTRDTVDLAMHPRAVVPRLTPGYEKEGGEIVKGRMWNVSTAYAAGAMVATVGDLLRLSEALDRPGFISAEGRSAMFTGGLGHYGCGWEVRRLPLGPAGGERAVVGHEGFIFWSLARIYKIPEDGIFVALVNNTGDAPLPAIFTGITDLLYGRTPAWPNPSAADAVRSIALEQGAAAALARYRELKASRTDDYLFDERGLNGLGYSLLGRGRTEDAVVVFRYVAEAYPDSANAWDSLGEGLASAGRREEAVKAYARSLERDPANRNAVEQLQRLTTAP